MFSIMYTAFDYGYYMSVLLYKSMSVMHEFRDNQTPRIVQHSQVV